MKAIRNTFLWAVLSVICLSAETAHAQVSVKCIVDTSVIRIGEQTTLRLSAIFPKNRKVQFPAANDTLRGLEVVERGKIDTAKTDTSEMMELSQRLIVTGFDSGFYVIEPFTFVFDGKDTLTTEAQLLEVRTISVDTTKSIKDIKPVLDPPFDWRELLPYLYVLAAILVAAYFTYRYLRNKKRVAGPAAVMRAPALPPHVIAFEALKNLEREKLWQQGAFKQYHSSLTEIVRTYIDGRYGISSMELTTDETIGALQRMSVNQEVIAPLEKLMRLADMVKFAKSVPLGPENESSLAAAREFIESTRVTEKEKES